MEYFYFKKFKVSHGKSGLKVNTDGLLLGAFAPKSDANLHILEIGSGCGFVSLMLSVDNPKASISAIDINQAAYEETVENFNNSDFKNRLEAIHTSIEAYQTQIPFDLIITNPPFFTNSLKSPNPVKNQALHTDISQFYTWIEKFKLLIKPKGLVHIILPNDILNELSLKFEMTGFKMIQHIQVFTKLEKAPFRHILTLKYTSDACEKTLKSIFIYEDNTYTEAYKNILRRYLTHFD